MRVRLNLTLVGRADMWKRNIPKGTQFEDSNKNTLLFVKNIVADQFGDRAITIIDENNLSDDIYSYPKYYAAGWFVSEGDNPTELVVVDHGESMELAVKAMLSSVTTIDWNSLSIGI
jgi:hypothetical protein